MLRCDQTVAWAALQGHWQAHGKDLDLREMFAQDPGRFKRWAIEAPHVMGDLSRARWDVATGRHLMSLARECVLGSRLSPRTPAYDIQQACGTGLENR